MIILEVNKCFPTCDVVGVRSDKCVGGSYTETKRDQHENISKREGSEDHIMHMRTRIKYHAIQQVITILD